MGTQTIDEKDRQERERNEKNLSNQEVLKDNVSQYIYRARLIKIFAQYEPSRLWQVNDLLKQYTNREEELIECFTCYYTGVQMLVLPSPPSESRTSSHRNRIRGVGLDLLNSCILKMKDKMKIKSLKRNHYFKILEESPRKEHSAVCNPENPIIDTTFEISDPIEEFQVKCLDDGMNIDIHELNRQIATSNSGIKLTSRDFRHKLIVFFEKYDMSMVEKVDEMIAFGGQTLDELWEEVQSTYGVNQRERLIRILRRYQPKALKHVDDLLYHYQGKEEELISSYREKFRYAQRSQVEESCTWKPGQANNYQILPSFDLGD